MIILVKAQVCELPRSNCGDNREGNFFEYVCVHMCVSTYACVGVFEKIAENYA